MATLLPARSETLRPCDLYDTRGFDSDEPATVRRPDRRAGQPSRPGELGTSLARRSEITRLYREGSRDRERRESHPNDKDDEGAETYRTGGHRPGDARVEE